MNVGPTARGVLDKRATDALKVYEDWMKYNSRSIYGCTMAEPEFKTPNGCRLTQSEDGKRLYIHIFEYPFKFLKLYGMADKIDYAQFLHDGSEIIFYGNISQMVAPLFVGEPEDTIVMDVPVLKPNTVVPVIEIFLK